MSQSCYYKRSVFGSNTIQGTIKFSKFVNTTFYLNGVTIELPLIITLNSNNQTFNNGTDPSSRASGLDPPLDDTYLGYEIPFTITQIPNDFSTSLSVTGAIIGQKIPCNPEVACKFSIQDPLGEIADGSVAVTIPKEYTVSNARLYFSVNGSYEDEIGTPYTINYMGLSFRNGWNSPPGTDYPFRLESSGLPIEDVYINNFLCEKTFLPYTQYKYSNNNVLREAWFWDIFSGLFFAVFWYWFYNYKMLIRIKE